MGLYPFLCAAVIFLCSVTSSFGESTALYLKAAELEEAGKYEEAAQIVSGIIKTEKSPHLYNRLTELYILSGNEEKAAAVLLEAEKVFPQDPNFKFTLGQLYELTQQDFHKAYEYYSAAAKLSSEHRYRIAAARAAESLDKHGEAIDIINDLISEKPLSLYYSDRGKVYQSMGKIDKAVADFKKAIEIDENMPAMLRLADIYLAENNLEEAKVLLEKITAKNDGLIIPELTLGEIYREEKDYAKAIELYSRAADRLQGKDRAAVLKQMATLQYETGDYDNASVTFEWVTELVPEDSMSAYFSGYIYEYLGKTAKAKEVYEKALKVHPDYAELLKRMAVISLSEDNLDEAEKYIGKINQVERDVDYYVILSEVYSRRGDHNKAALVLIEGLEENPTHSEILYSLAMQYEYLNERDKTIATVKKALSAEPDNAVFQNFLGYVYADMGINLEEAHSLISKALEQDPENPAYIDSMAWVLFRMKDYSNAYKYIKKAAAAAPEDPEISGHLKAIKEKVGE